jgi:hypothetical protein
MFGELLVFGSVETKFGSSVSWAPTRTTKRWFTIFCFTGQWIFGFLVFNHTLIANDVVSTVAQALPEKFTFSDSNSEES